jgi:hypothetical protein
MWTNYTSDDFVRGNNQQLVIKGLISEIKNIRDVNTIDNILKSVSNNIETNMNINEILSLYNIVKKVIILSNDVPIEFMFGLQKLQISGYDLIINDFSLKDNQGTKLNLYNFIPYKGSIKDVSDAMKRNLGILKEERITLMNFSALLPYKEIIIGKNNYSEKAIELVPTFLFKHEDEVKAWSDRNNIKLELNYITSSNPDDFVGMVKRQTALPNMEVRFIGSNGFKVDVVEKIIIEEKELD